MEFDGVTWWLVAEFAVIAAAVLLGVAVLLSLSRSDRRHS
jgi:hypothetical protein